MQRGYGSFQPNSWEVGATVSSPIMAEHHNALKDAIIKIQHKIGLADNPAPDSIHHIVRRLEHRWLAPKAAFKAFPTNGSAPLKVKFQNFSGGHGLHFLWDFGDGTTSSEKNPTHTYDQEGVYTVKLNMISVLKSHGFTEKTNYIKVSNDLRQPMFYAKPRIGYSYESKPAPTEFEFIDQTDGQIVERHWFFGDGQDLVITNPNVHTAKHTYERPGNYAPSLIIKYVDEQISRVSILEEIMVY